jgi:hypothetical protein
MESSAAEHIVAIIVGAFAKRCEFVQHEPPGGVGLGAVFPGGISLLGISVSSIQVNTVSACLQSSC